MPLERATLYTSNESKNKREKNCRLTSVAHCFYNIVIFFKYFVVFKYGYNGIYWYIYIIYVYIVYAISNMRVYIFISIGARASRVLLAPTTNMIFHFPVRSISISLSTLSVCTHHNTHFLLKKK